MNTTPHLNRTLLQRLEDTDTRYICGSCGMPLNKSKRFDIEDVRVLIGNLTGSCPNCRKPLEYAAGRVRFSTR